MAFEHIGSILKRQIGTIKAIHIAQKELGSQNPHVMVLLAMIQMCLLEGDERDLAKWMSFYMLKKIEREAGPELFSKIKEEAENMDPKEILDLASKALTAVGNQREEIITLFEKGKKDD